jgi:hypothetical protein
MDKRYYRVTGECRRGNGYNLCSEKMESEMVSFIAGEGRTTGCGADSIPERTMSYQRTFEW